MDKVQHGHQREPHVHADGAARHLDAPLLQLDLPFELAALRKNDKAMGKGHLAKTLAKYADLRLVLIAFEPGGRLEQHKAPGRVCVHVLDGRVALRLGDQRVELGAGGLLEIAPHVLHDVEALEPSGLLLTVAWPTQADPSQQP